MKKFKLNTLEKNQLLTVKGGRMKFKEKFDEEMDSGGGSSCSCGCAYANSGGSSSSDNSSANSAQGLNS